MPIAQTLEKTKKTKNKSKNHKNLGQKQKTIWGLLGGPSISQDFLKIVFFVFSKIFFLFFLVLVAFGHPRKKETHIFLDSLEGGGQPRLSEYCFFNLFPKSFVCFSFGLPDSQGPIVILC